ncbi:AraC-like DNA-binding protein [Agromyces sp. 3263]|uniref:helix-turn-helix transcriptional regulator n=1 Tax=Agromyces sp. 3263 TaxID=2817750 RepID=UPI00285F1363|nr:helix-turn-helix transcriptional regulator [Agromyces sp. 3263]MDR6906577.1 AraC-like DNA-binding protein [Agromyces sp. 3263]
MPELEHQSRSFDDVDSAHEWFAEYFPERRFGVDQDGRFGVRVSMSTSGRFSFIDSAWTAPGTATGGTHELTVISGAGRGYRLTQGPTDLDACQPLLAPADGLAVRWEERRTSVVALEFAAVERIARAATGYDALRLRRTGLVANSPELADHWVTVLRGIRSSLAREPGLLDAPLVANATFHHLATAFLHAFPTNWLESPDERRGGSAVVRRAIEYMHAHAGEPITITDVASAVFISTRGLHFAFTRELGESPAQVLRRIRLEGARSDLRAAGADATVAKVARAWGFAHHQRFADSYRRAFGERPSETLRSR